VKPGLRPAAIDCAVMPLEGLWWSDDMAAFAGNDRQAWHWTLLIMQPSYVTDAVLATAVAEVRRTKDLPALEQLRVDALAEGRCAQILHVGPFTQEGPTIERLHAYIQARGSLAGRHHEIYLSDIRRADPKNWKTIIRQPLR